MTESEVTEVRFGVGSLVIRYVHAIQMPEMFNPMKVKTQMETLDEGPEDVYTIIHDRPSIEQAWTLLQPILQYETQRGALEKVYARKEQRKQAAALSGGSC